MRQDVTGRMHFGSTDMECIRNCTNNCCNDCGRLAASKGGLWECWRHGLIMTYNVHVDDSDS